MYVYLSICAMELRNAGYLLSTSSRDNRDGRSSRDSAVDVKSRLSFIFSPALFFILASENRENCQIIVGWQPVVRLRKGGVLGPCRYGEQQTLGI